MKEQQRKVKGQKKIPVNNQNVTQVHLQGGKLKVTGYGEVDTSELNQNNDILDRIQIDEDTAPADILRAARLEVGLTQKRLGQKIGVSGKNITSYENSYCMIKPTVAKHLGKHLGIPSDLLTI